MNSEAAINWKGTIAKLREGAIGVAGKPSQEEPGKLSYNRRTHSVHLLWEWKPAPKGDYRINKEYLRIRIFLVHNKLRHLICSHVLYSEMRVFAWLWASLKVSIDDPLSSAIRTSNRKLGDYFLERLRGCATREEFLDMLGVVWYTEMVLDLKRRRTTVESLMRPILSIGKKLGIDVEDVNSLDERLRKNIRARKILGQ